MPSWARLRGRIHRRPARIDDISLQRCRAMKEDARNRLSENAEAPVPPLKNRGLVALPNLVVNRGLLTLANRGLATWPNLQTGEPRWHRNRNLAHPSHPLSRRASHYRQPDPARAIGHS